MTTVKTLVMWSLIGIFCFGAFLFCPNFVSFPVYTTAPYLPIGYEKGGYANCVNWSCVTCRRRFCAERLTFVDASMHSLHGIPLILRTERRTGRYGSPDDRRKSRETAS